MIDLCLESISFLEKVKQKNISSNIIGPSPKKPVALIEKVEKASGKLDYVKVPVVTIRQ